MYCVTFTYYSLHKITIVICRLALVIYVLLFEYNYICTYSYNQLSNTKNCSYIIADHRKVSYHIASQLANYVAHS